MYPAQQQVSCSPLRPAYTLILVIALLFAAPQVTLAQFGGGGGGMGGMGGMQQKIGELKLLSPRNRRGDPANAAAIYVGQSQAKNAEIARALTKRVDCRLTDVALKDAAEFFAEHLGHPVVIDEESLDHIGLDSNRRVYILIEDVQLEHVLKQLLDSVGLVYTVVDGAVKICSPESATDDKLIRFYPIGDLVASSAASHDALISLLTSSLMPDSWEDVGGIGTVSSRNGSLVIGQSYHVHQQVEHLLDVLRKFRDDTYGRKELPASYQLELLETRVERRVEPTKENRSEGRNPFGEAKEDPFKEEPQDPFAGEPQDPFEGEAKAQALPHIIYALVDWLTRDSFPESAAPEYHVVTIETSWGTRLYPVAQLVYGNGREPAADLDELAETITSLIDPDAWSVLGGAGTIDQITEPPALLISQDLRTHAEITDLLETLEIVARTERKLVRPPRERKKPGSLVTEVYPRPPARNSKAESITATELAELIETVLGPDAASHRGSILHVVDDRVLVLQTPENHQKVLDVLQKLYRHYQVEQEPGFNYGGMGGGGMGGGGMGGGFF